MIHSLRRKFIMIASGAILIVIALVLASINGINYFSAYHDINSLLDFITENNGRMPSERPSNGEVSFHVTPELIYETRYFSLVLDMSTNEIVNIDYDHISAVEEDDIEEFYNTVLNDSDGNGKLETDEGTYYFKSKNVSGDALLQTYSHSKYSDSEAIEAISADEQYRLVVFMDCTDRMYRIKMNALFSALAGLICFALFILIVSALSKRAIKPAIESYEKQKQFITNAGHELKTPLAIISANAEVLETVEGKNEWTGSIVNQVNRLTGLVNDLIKLARMEENGEKPVMEKTDLSAKVREVADSFVTVAAQQGKTLDTDITDGVNIMCSEKSVHELISILIDNAVKYCDDGGEIKVVLSRAKRYAVIEVRNTYLDGENVDYGRFFERFYRGDTSHNRDKAAGYGIGLSMAERIVKQHKGRITAGFENGTVLFTVSLPCGM